jgi:hypothetical protein
MAPNGVYPSRRVGSLTRPTDRDLVIQVNFYEFGCAVPGEAIVQAWAAPLTGPVGCDERRDPYCNFPKIPPQQWVAMASQTSHVEVDGGGGCRNGRIPINLTLEPTEPASHAPSGASRD